MDFYLYQQMVIYDLLKRCLLRLESEASWKRVLKIGLRINVNMGEMEDDVLYSSTEVVL